MSTNTDRLVNDLKRVTQDAEEILKDTREDISEKACAARQRLVATIESAKAQCQKLEEKAVTTAKATDKVIREHPYQFRWNWRCVIRTRPLKTRSIA